MPDLRIPLNRIVAFAGPYIAIAAGAIAAVLVSVVNILGIPGLDKANIATWVSAALVFLVTCGLKALGGWAWLKGHHIIIANEAAAIAHAQIEQAQRGVQPR